MPMGLPRMFPNDTLSIADVYLQQEVGPSLTHVTQLCLMTLNNLLCQDAHAWQPIVPIC